MTFIQYNSKGQYHGTCQFKAWSILYDNGVPLSVTLDDGTVIKPDKNTEITNEYIVFKNDNGKTHREDGPAIIGTNGYKEWYISGKKHRVDGPAIIWSNGDKSWWLNGKTHRADGPAVIWSDGSKSWWLNGKTHREDGPAYIWSDGSKAWYINGMHYGKGEEPPKEYLQALVDQGYIKHVDDFVRGSDDSQ